LLLINFSLTPKYLLGISLPSLIQQISSINPELFLEAF